MADWNGRSLSEFSIQSEIINLKTAISPSDMIVGWNGRL